MDGRSALEDSENSMPSPNDSPGKTFTASQTTENLKNVRWADEAIIDDSQINGTLERYVQWVSIETRLAHCNDSASPIDWIEDPPWTEDPPDWPVSERYSAVLEDAGRYLDHLKVNHTSADYNNFLDIMRDFKNGAIDTPGVMGRVSGLLCNNADSIDSFNRFLPPGYKMKQLTDVGPARVRATTPGGSVQYFPDESRPLRSNKRPLPMESRSQDVTQDPRRSSKRLKATSR